MKTIVYKSLIFLSVFALLLAGYYSHFDEPKAKSAMNANKTASQDETIVKSVAFEATASVFHSAVQRFSVLLFSFEFSYEMAIPEAVFFPKFLNSFKHILFSRISPVNAP